MIISKEISKEIVKELTSNVGVFTECVDKLTLHYRKVNIGGRYCYDIEYDGKRVPLIFFRMDLETPDIIININILERLKYGYGKTLYAGNTPFEYDGVDEIIKKHRKTQLTELLKLK
jgi:hypothetical protein